MKQFQFLISKRIAIKDFLRYMRIEGRIDSPCDIGDQYHLILGGILMIALSHWY